MSEAEPLALRRVGFLASAIAAFTLVVAALARHYGWFELRPGGASFEARIYPVFGLFYGAALIVSLRRTWLGAIMAAFGGSALIAFATNQLVPSQAALILVGIAVPALLWLIVAVTELDRRGATRTLIATGVMTVVGFAVGHAVYDAAWGPTHPESTVAELAPSPLRWVWAGNVTATSAEVRAKPDRPAEQAVLLVADNPDFTDPTRVDARDGRPPVFGFVVDDLEPATEYHYAVEIDGTLDAVRTGRFRTFPSAEADFVIAVGSCARIGSNGRVFDTIASHDPLLYLITGDFHYGDIRQNDIERYREVMDLTLSEPAQSALYRSTAIAYVWDDHDYGPNNADSASTSRVAAMASYREHVPSYPLAGPETAVHQAFTIGRVRVVMTDARSARDQGAGTLLGDEQKAWLLEELEASASTHPLVVWVNPVPWVDDADPLADTWGGFADERTEIANFIVEHDIDNLLMVSGDAHMVAIDDGSNTNFSDHPGSGFPLLQAAALDRPGSLKGGPYSEGAIAGGGQFGIIEIDDRASEIEVTLTARNWQDEVLMTHSFVVPTGTPGA